MQIQPIQKHYHNNQPEFKAAYPVTHWLADTNGSYAPVTSLELAKKLQRILITFLNKTTKKDCHTEQSKAVDYLKKCDLDYRNNPIVRTFYDWKSEHSSDYSPLAYLITGFDVKNFNENYGKKIGKEKRNGYISAELNRVLRDYEILGLNYVKSFNRKIYNEDGIECSLHTKFETIRNKNGKIKGYRFVDLKFCPDKGNGNPFIRAGLKKI